MTSNEKIKEIQERLSKVSPGPWTVHEDIRPDVVHEEIKKATNDIEKSISVYQHLKETNQLAFTESAVVYCPKGSGFWNEGQIIREMSKTIGHVCELASYWTDTHSNINDAYFIAHAREDIPFLLDEIKRLTTMISQQQV